MSTYNNILYTKKNNKTWYYWNNRFDNDNDEHNSDYI